MDQLDARLNALEQQMHSMNRRLRWWRGLVGGVLMLAGLTWALPAVIAQEEEAKGKGPKGLAQRVEALEQLLKHFSREKNEIFITGANLHIVNGLGETDCTDDESGEPIPDCPNGLGNLIVGYNELREPIIGGEDIRTGSHNVVVGMQHNFSRFGGLVGGLFNTISGDFATVSGGFNNTASGFLSSVCGGQANVASGGASSVSGGVNNTASGLNFAAISGGRNNTASGDFGASVSGGFGNTASGEFSSVSGGRNITQETEAGWSAGSEAEEAVVGNFRSP
jgi:hypothetical protein